MLRWPRFLPGARINLHRYPGGAAARLFLCRRDRHLSSMYRRARVAYWWRCAFGRGVPACSLRAGTSSHRAGVMRSGQRAELKLLWGRSVADRGDAMVGGAQQRAERLALLTEALYALSVAPAARAAAATTHLPPPRSRPGAPCRAVAELESSGGALRVESFGAALGVAPIPRQPSSATTSTQSPKLFASHLPLLCPRLRPRQAWPAGPRLGQPRPRRRLLRPIHLIRDFRDYRHLASYRHRQAMANPALSRESAVCGPNWL